ncbi:hypothetical protein [Mucilaginibacter antarcticus]|uniref:hypothetical protein n=1 Tax=Mucilaginibacter antarcticus TaxID=1855725 RepID=UPI00362B39BF
MQMPKVLESDWDDLPEIAKGWAASPVDYDIMKKVANGKKLCAVTWPVSLLWITISVAL